MTKRKIVTIAVAVIFAVTMVIGGGTLAYLTGASVGVTNQAEKNFNWVSITETEGNPVEDSEGNITNTAYEIVPGTSEAKDPTVSVSYSVDSYVFVTIEDTSGGEIFDFDVDSAYWTLLTSSTDGDGVITYVYYHLCEEGESGATSSTASGVTYYKNSYNVLEDNTISYYSSIDNNTLVESFTSTGDPTFYDDEYKLIFQAYIIQADPFYSTSNNNSVAQGAESAYLALLNDPAAYASAGYSAMVNGVLYTDLSSAVSAATAAGGSSTITVVADTELTSALVFTTSTSAKVTLDLNGNSITYSSSAASSVSESHALIRVGEGVTLTLTGDGVVDGTDMDANAELVWARGGTVIIESGTYIAQTANEACVYASSPDDGTSVGTVYIYGGTFKNTATGSYAYGSSLSPLTLNLWNGTISTGYNNEGVSSGDIIVYGGVFYGNDPADGDDCLSTKDASETQRAVTTFVADGYKSVAVADGSAYVVVEDDDAVTAVGSATELTTALSTSGVETIVVAGEVELTSAISISNDVTIDGQGTASISGYPITVTADVTFKDITLSTPDNSNNNASLVYAYAGCESLVFDGVTFEDPQWEAIQVTSKDITTLTITNCTFTAANVDGASASGYSNNDADDALRYVHVQFTSGDSHDIAITITGNTFENCDKVSEELFGFYRLGSGSTVKVGNNTFDPESGVEDDHLYNYDTSSSNSSPLKELSTWTGSVQTVTSF